MNMVVSHLISSCTPACCLGLSGYIRYAPRGPVALLAHQQTDSVWLAAYPLVRLMLQQHGRAVFAHIAAQTEEEVYIDRYSRTHTLK